MLRDTRIQNVAGLAENSIRINGTTNSRIQNVSLENVRVKLDRWTRYPSGRFDNRPIKVLEPIETNSTPGVCIRSASDVTLKNCSVTWGRNLPDYFTEALETENVTGLRLTRFEGNAAHPNRDPSIFVH